MPTLIELACPNCGHNLTEENLHSNILQCPRCNSYTYYESGMFNQNVFFGLLRCQSYQLDKLRNMIIDKFVKQGSLKAIRHFKYLHAERLLIPMREFNVHGQPKAVSLLEENRDTADENADVRRLLQGRSDISSLFSMQNLHPLRLSDVCDEIDSSGYITRTTVMPVGRTKRSIDTAYSLQPDSMLKILYLPIYRISFNDDKQKVLCFANEELTGLEVKESKQWSGIDLDFDSFSELASVLGVLGVPLSIITIIVVIAVGGISISGGSTFGVVFLYIMAYMLLFIFLTLIYSVVAGICLLLFSRLPVSLNVITTAKKWLIRRILTSKFRLNERRR